MKNSGSSRTPVRGAAPSVKDVARAAGVSTATVSRTLNRPETVAESTRNAVLVAAKQTGYRVNVAARNLRSQRAGAVAVLVPNIGNTFFSQILAGIESVLTEDGFSVLVVDTMQEKSSSGLLLDYLHPGRVDGIISLDGALGAGFGLPGTSIGGGPVPIVFACEWPNDFECTSVRVQNRAGARLAVNHLAALGHKKIGYINGPSDNVLSHVRMEGFQQALERLGVDPEPDWIFEGDFSMESGSRAAGEWLSLDERPTAMFCANDESAVGFIAMLHRNHVSVPHDVSVIGFDDVEVSQHFIPPLTTIRQPRSEIGRTAAKLLGDQISARGWGPIQKEVLPVELVPRGSTAPLNRASRHA